MQRRIDPPPALLDLARRQAGVVSSEQVEGFGLTKRPLTRLLDAARWQRLARGLYVVHDQEPTWLSWAWGGLLLGGPSARLGGLAAGHLYGLNDPPRLLDVMVPMSAPRTGPWPLNFVKERAGVRSSRSPGDPARLSIEDTVIDLTEQCTEGEVVDLVTRAVQSRRTTAQRLGRCAAARRRLRHRRLLNQLLGDIGQGAQSAFELRFLHDVERPHELPRGNRQYRAGHGPYWQDVRYEEYQLVVELDGRLGHDGTGRFRDMYRDNAGVVEGVVTLRYGWHDVTDRPCAMAFQVGHVLMRRGWFGVPSRCDRCRNAPERDIE